MQRFNASKPKLNKVNITFKKNKPNLRCCSADTALRLDTYPAYMLTAINSIKKAVIFY
jgi:hypothetical protein